MKKLIIAVLSLVTIASLTACGSGNGSNESSKSDNNTSATEYYDDDSNKPEETDSDSTESESDEMPESRFTPYEYDSSATPVTALASPDFTDIDGQSVINNPLGDICDIEQFEEKLLGEAPELKTDLKLRRDGYSWTYNENDGKLREFTKNTNISAYADSLCLDTKYEINYRWDSITSPDVSLLELNLNQLENVNDGKRIINNVCDGIIKPEYLNAVLNAVTSTSEASEFDKYTYLDCNSQFSENDIFMLLDGAIYYPVKEFTKSNTYPKINTKFTATGHLENSVKLDNYIEPQEAVSQLPSDITKVVANYNPFDLKKFQIISFSKSDACGTSASGEGSTASVSGYDSNNSLNSFSVSYNDQGELSSFSLNIRDIPAGSADLASQAADLVNKYFGSSLTASDFYTHDDGELTTLDTTLNLSGKETEVCIGVSYQEYQRDYLLFYVEID